MSQTELSSSTFLFFLQDPFRTTEDPFRAPATRTPATRRPSPGFGGDRRPEQQDFNTFQNNERGSQRPQSPSFGGGDRRRPGGGLQTGGGGAVRNRPQVDEFGNPLEEIHSVDTTRFELGDGVDAREVRCPRNWHRFGESCYKFTRSPFKPWDRARGICQAFKHQDQVRIFLRRDQPPPPFL